MKLVGKKLSKRFGALRALVEIDIEVIPGGITAIIGPSGSGKTTLLRSLSLLEPPDSGAILIDEQKYSFPDDLGTYTPPWPKVTVVFQQLFLWPHLTLRANIELPIRKRVSSDRENITNLIKIFDMEEFVDRYPNEVSIGQRQRAAIVRAIALEPKYILLDEITSSLDVEQISKLLKYLLLLRNEGIGILIVTHLLGFAKRAADKIVFLDEGQAVECGGTEILEYPREKRLADFLEVMRSAS